MPLRQFPSIRHGATRPEVHFLVAVAVIMRACCLAEDPAAISRGEIQAAFKRDLDEVARQADDRGLPGVAQSIRSWFVPRIPHRVYVFLPQPRPENAPDLDDEWSEKLRQLRARQAKRLWQLAEQLLNEQDVGAAYQVLFEILRQDPQDPRARRVVGQAGTSPLPSLRVSVAKSRQTDLNWGPRTYWRIQTPNYQIFTNHSEQQGRQLAELLEENAAVWRELFVRYWADAPAIQLAFAGRPLKLPRNIRHEVVLFADRAEYVDYLRPKEPQVDITLGMYRDRDRRAYFFVDDQDLAKTWRHEAVHQLFQEHGRIELDIGRQQDFWLVEAVAMYFESARRANGYYELGGIDAPRLQYARYRRLQEEFHVPLSQLAQLGKRQLQTDRRIRRIYTESAGLAHFFMDHKNPAYRQAFVEAVAAVYQGRSAIEPLLAVSAGASLDDEYQQFLRIGDEQLAAVRPDTELLTLGHTRVTDRGLSTLTELPSLRWLDLTNLPISDEAFARFGGCRQLRQLSLENTRVTDRSLEHINRFTELEELDLSGTNVTSSGLARLQGLKDLQVLWLTRTQIDDEVIPVLQTMSNLEQVDVSGTGVTKQGQQRLRDSLPRLSR